MMNSAPSKAKPVRLHRYVYRGNSGAVAASRWSLSVDGAPFEQVIGGLPGTVARAMAVAGWNGEFSK